LSWFASKFPTADLPVPGVPEMAITCSTVIHRFFL
jgi:hypothetical protein